MTANAQTVSLTLPTEIIAVLDELAREHREATGEDACRSDVAVYLMTGGIEQKRRHEERTERLLRGEVEPETPAEALIVEMYRS